VTVRLLSVELTEFIDTVTQKVFNKRLNDIEVALLVVDSERRAELLAIRTLVEDAEFKGAMERMAFVMFEVYERRYLESQQRARWIKAKREGREPPTFGFPEFEGAIWRLDFIELGIDPQEYEAFHMVVPQVGLLTASPTAFIMRKDRATWHVANLNRANCLRA